ncbi:MAG: hypothetical protein WKF35_06980 [Ferruginibacter sp.]
MFNNEDILKELENISPVLIPLQQLNVFSVPENYFTDFSEMVLLEVSAETPAFLTSEVANTREVPAGYFDSLADTILAKIKITPIQSAVEELKELSPALSTTGNDNVFTVPSRYFEDLSEIILSQVKPAAKIVEMRSHSSFMRYAVAAVITGIMGLSLFSVFDKKNIETIESTPLTASVLNDANKILQTNSFDKVLETVSEDEIIGYLQKNGQDVNAALVAASVDLNELPSADDYIINEDALTDFLKELNIKDYSN